MECDYWLCCRYARLDFAWMATGSIEVVTNIQALPFVSLRTGSSSNSRILAAFVLLVLLTAVQLGVVAYSLWVRMSEATSLLRILQVLLSMEKNTLCLFEHTLNSCKIAIWTV